ncbi:ABC transporter ATP-binding protein [Thioalkalivibrio sp. ALJ16]|uniref:ABC transporter ATP-binding protein n=1 Tax=Thioalkalivibrio sp. ALJ16 TaxID=1158762 RepID=UPI00036D48A5|nr:ABC transporter ATP-binding protein [Thioalkalivibrio sp. ALJ16]
MLNTIRKLHALLDAPGRRRAYLMLLLIVALAFVEMVGVASIMPFVMVLANPEVVETNRHLNALYTGLGFESTDRFMFFLGVAMMLALLTTITFKALVTYLMQRFMHMRSYALSRNLVESYLRQPYDHFLNRNSADLGKSILAEAEQVVKGALKPLMLFLAGAAVSLAIIILLFIVDPRLAGAITAGLALGYGGIYLVARGILNRLGRRRVAANRGRFEAVQECFGGIKEVKVTGLEGPYLKRFEQPAKRYARTQATAVLFKEVPKYVLQAMTYGGAFLVILYLLRQPGGLQAAIPTLAVFALGAQRLLPALGDVYKNLSLMRFTDAALDNLHQDLARLRREETLSTKELKGRPPQPLGLNHAIELDHVHYTYPGAERPALNDLTLTIPARTTVGLVGATGSGKTTTVDIILGLLTPGAGALKVDGTPITTDNVRAWQRTIGYVPQHIYLSDDTIAANVAFGVPSAKIDQAAVERAARIANVHEFVVNEMPQGYATPVGERGVRLSGGQRQRIGIARALYHDPEVLILDEATSALDNLTEQAVMEAVHNLGHRKTIILIAHRLSTVRECDTIFLLEKGEVKGQGAFDELAESNVRFRAMAASH